MIVVLPSPEADHRRARLEAEVVLARYREGGSRSVYETSSSRIAQGFRAELAIARWLGVKRTDPRGARWKAGDADLPPDLEVRSVSSLAPEALCVTLYRRDLRRAGRRFVLAWDGGDTIRVYGWARGSELLLPEAVQLTSREGRPFTIIGVGYPDQLHDANELLELTR